VIRRRPTRLRRPAGVAQAGGQVDFGHEAVAGSGQFEAMDFQLEPIVGVELAGSADGGEPAIETVDEHVLDQVRKAVDPARARPGQQRALAAHDDPAGVARAIGAGTNDRERGL
jgi:hypothetical protein